MSETQDAVARLFGAARRNRRMLPTPEGVELPVDVSEPGERLAAFLIDFFIWLCATLALYVLIVALFLSGFAGAIAVTLILFTAFVVRNLYFIYFEILWRGATPGKRLYGLRVIDRRGGPLESGAVVARNLTREVEIFLPAGVLISAGAGAGAFEMLALAVWLLLFTALPLFNRDRLRAGDLIAGTMVIAIPRRLLLADLVGAPAAYAFTPRQLGVYGVFELQVLEELLRRPVGPDTEPVLADVCGKIAAKIGWPDPVPPAGVRAFLDAFYAAERAHLERERLFGKTRADKHG
jgi:uncharacterized RDD family membrane protein YckC